MAETILVTAAAGKIGSRLVKLLTAEGDARVRAGVHSIAKGADLAAGGAHVVELDLDNPGSVAQAVAGVDTIFLITPFSFHSVEQVDSVIAAAEPAHVKRVVRLSVLGAESEPGITLTRQHRACERAIMGSGIEWTFLRPTGFMQNLEQFAAQIKSEGVFYQPIGEARVSYIDADDIAAVAFAILTGDSAMHDGRAYDLTGPEALDRHQIAKLLSDALGKPVRFETVPDDAAAQAMESAGMPKPAVAAFIELFQAYRAGVSESADTGVEFITGRPATSFAAYLAEDREKYR